MISYEEAMQLLSEMKTRYDDGFSSLDRKYLESIYFSLFGKEITNKGCSNCYRDAFIEINVKLKKIRTMPKKSEFVLKAGAVITFFGEQKCYTNVNMTDEAALRFLSLNPSNEKLFEKLPDGWKDRLAAPQDDDKTSKESEKDEIIARLTADVDALKAENDALKAEVDSLKSGKSGKKGRKKSEPEVEAESHAPALEEAPTIDHELSVEEIDEDTL